MSHLTIGRLANLLNKPEWKVRREVDALGVDIPRAGRYRLVPSELIPQLVERLGRTEKREAASV